MKGATLLLAIIVLFTFPIWLGLIAGGFGLIIGIFGAMFGMIAGVFGAIFGLFGWIIESIFNGIFGWGHDWSFFSFPHFHINRFGTVALIIIAAFLISRRNAVKDKDTG